MHSSSTLRSTFSRVSESSHGSILRVTLRTKYILTVTPLKGEKNVGIDTRMCTSVGMNDDEHIAQVILHPECIEE
jgi:hypothetical protein